MFGEGQFSAVTTVQAATKPDQISTPLQQIVNNDLRVTWIQPNKRGSDINKYNVFVINSLGKSVEYLPCA